MIFLYCRPAPCTGCARAGVGGWSAWITFFRCRCWGGGDDICAQKYLLPLQSGRLTLPVRLSLEDAGYAPAAACLAEAEELCRTRRMGYELGIKGAMLRFLALVLALQNLPPRPAGQRR